MDYECPKKGLQSPTPFELAIGVKSGEDRGMNQITQGLDSLLKKTRREVFLEHMKTVVLRQALGALIHP